MGVGEQKGNDKKRMQIKRYPDGGCYGRYTYFELTFGRDRTQNKK